MPEKNTERDDAVEEASALLAEAADEADDVQGHGLDDAGDDQDLACPTSVFCN
jgi:hypothetical protein